MHSAHYWSLKILHNLPCINFYLATYISYICHLNSIAFECLQSVNCSKV